MAPKKGMPSVSAELSLIHLQKCLVNLPPSLVSLLMNLDTVSTMPSNSFRTALTLLQPTQNVIVELSFNDGSSGSERSRDSHSTSKRSVYVGWTGMPSKHKVASLMQRSGLSDGRDSALREKEVSLVEIDAILALTLGLYDGQKVETTVHVDPPLAHTVSIEPLTPEDWEMIELHATFLEFNFLNQVRALPNPAYMSDAAQHPLVLHLSPTNTAKVKVVSLEPAPPPNSPFVKIAPEAEVIVAPKSRAKPQRLSKESRSVTSTSRRSGKSVAGTVKRKGDRTEQARALYLRPVDRALVEERFDAPMQSQSLVCWVDGDILHASGLQGMAWVQVSIVRPSTSPSAQLPTESTEAPAQSQALIAQVLPWENAPSAATVALSTPLAAALGCLGVAGGVVKVASAPLPVPRKTASSDGQPDTVQKLRFYPFVGNGAAAASDSIRFGGESKAEKDAASRRIIDIYGSVLSGPLVDGMVLPPPSGYAQVLGVSGGLLKFDPLPVADSAQTRWLLGSEWQLPLDVQPPMSSPKVASGFALEQGAELVDLVGVDALLGVIQGHIMHLSSALLTGGLGSGKTAVAESTGSTLKKRELFHTSYVPCAKLANDDSKISSIKDTLNQVFAEASWSSRLAGKSVVILDDLDKLCPAETELQIGNENSRGRQLAETVSSVVRKYCSNNSRVVLLATAQSKDSLHNLIIASHVIRDIVNIKAPDKETRRVMLETMVTKDARRADEIHSKPELASRPTTADGSVSADEGNGWMEANGQSSLPGYTAKVESSDQATAFVVDSGVDFLDLAGQVDGYMPGDLLLLNSRARNAALIRSDTDDANANGAVHLRKEDFDKALKGFTPASLRNVNLQSSTVKFDSIGGLRDTRRILLETLQYPTKYAPLFAQVPLRLRSGLLLYGYPGCGKTLLASAVAGECGLNFISVKGPEILNKYIGASEKAVRDLFERAQAAKPCILFFDEFDSIAPKRGHDSTGVTDRVVNQLLTQMDGAEGLSGVYVLAATSRPDLIDPALLRPGRLDKSLLCDFPNLGERVDIIKALAKQVRISGDVLDSEDELWELAQRTEGFSGADMQALMSNAQLEAIHDVLNDDSSSGKSRGNVRKSRQGDMAQNASLPPRKIMQFRYGPDEAGSESAKRNGATKAAELAERASIVAKLDGLKLARKKARQQKLETRSGHAAVNGTEGDKTAANGGEVIIELRHIASALSNTRPSISVDERRRLERIYHEFVVGRSGEMRDGQASMEIGGRSSLM
jgi:peroxin-1